VLVTARQARLVDLDPDHDKDAVTFGGRGLGQPTVSLSRPDGLEFARENQTNPEKSECQILILRALRTTVAVKRVAVIAGGFRRIVPAEKPNEPKISRHVSDLDSVACARPP
jgi:hypothetical protein